MTTNPIPGCTNGSGGSMWRNSRSWRLTEFQDAIENTMDTRVLTTAAMLAMATTVAAAGKTPDPTVDSLRATFKGERTVGLTIN